MPAVTITIKDYDMSGMDFVCPTCKRPGIFDWYKFCPYCGVEYDWKLIDLFYGKEKANE